MRDKLHQRIESILNTDPRIAGEYTQSTVTKLAELLKGSKK